MADDGLRLAASEINAKTAPKGAAECGQDRQILLDLAFFVFNMLALDGVIFLDDHFIGHGARVFLGHIKVPRACRRVQTDLDRRRFGHRNSPRAQMPG